MGGLIDANELKKDYEVNLWLSNEIQHPNAKIAYGRYGLQIVMPKEEEKI